MRSTMRCGQARAQKPVVVYMESLAASGGYYVSCGGKFLMASDTTITGSIGVIIQTLNYEQLFNKVGLASVVFKSGKFKDMLNGARPITPEERELVQSFHHENLRQVSRHRREGKKSSSQTCCVIRSPTAESYPGRTRSRTS